MRIVAFVRCCPKISTLQLTKFLSELLCADSAYLGSLSALSAKIDTDGRLGITPKKVTCLVRERIAALRKNEILADTYRSNGKRWISLKGHFVCRFQHFTHIIAVFRYTLKTYKLPSKKLRFTNR